MNKKTYEKIKSKISSYKYGVAILKGVNKITTRLVYFIYPLFLTLLGVNRDPRFWKSLFVPGISFIILSIFRKHINCQRPYEKLDIIPIIDKDTKGKSFPSRHVFSVYVIGMTLYQISIPLGVGIMLIGIIIGVVRVLGGVHFPRDVIAGAIIGILSSLIGWNFNMFF